MVIYAVHDVLADTWSFPQVSPTEASAKRDFLQFRSRPNVPGNDLECVKVGMWNPDVGRLVPVDPSVLVPAAPKEGEL